ncbi:hypothetical protein BASA81_012500 [Batrachochytrium salamandrivorans]|nr:hypothetical protein BASA81_012500 [Batrachochytrium salamandrivorans]
MQSVKSMPTSATVLRAVPTLDPAEVDFANNEEHVPSDKELREEDKSETGSVVEPQPACWISNLSFNTCCCPMLWLLCGNGNSEVASEEEATAPKQLRNDALNSQSSSMRSEITRHDTNSWVVEDANV